MINAKVIKSEFIQVHGTRKKNVEKEQNNISRNSKKIAY